MWIPLVLMGSVLFWTVALGLGRMSLSLLGDSGDHVAPARAEQTVFTQDGFNMVTLPSPQTAGPVEVQIISRDSQPGSGGNHANDDGTGRLPAIDESPPAPPLDEPPGKTSY